MAKCKNYEVGYGKPPRQTRFKAGQSGNPKGRPKGARGVKSQVREVLTSPVVVKSGGKSRSVPAFYAMLLRLRQTALEGDLRAIKQCLELGILHLPDETTEAAKSLGDADQHIWDTYFRLRDASPEASGNDQGPQGAGPEELP